MGAGNTTGVTCLAPSAIASAGTGWATTGTIYTALTGKEDTITAGTTAQYFRGDKTWQTLNKAAVGLGNVDNTSDANKPVSSATQTALDSKQATITGGATTIVGDNLTASRALVSDANGKVAVSAMTATQLGYVSGVTSAIQTQLNAKLATFLASCAATSLAGGAGNTTSLNCVAPSAIASGGTGWATTGTLYTALNATVTFYRKMTHTP